MGTAKKSHCHLGKAGGTLFKIGLPCELRASERPAATSGRESLDRRFNPMRRFSGNDSNIRTGWEAGTQSSHQNCKRNSLPTPGRYGVGIRGKGYLPALP